MQEPLQQEVLDRIDAFAAKLETTASQVIEHLATHLAIEAYGKLAGLGIVFLMGLIFLARGLSRFRTENKQHQKDLNEWRALPEYQRGYPRPELDHACIVLCLVLPLIGFAAVAGTVLVQAGPALAQALAPEASAIRELLNLIS